MKRLSVSLDFKGIQWRGAREREREPKEGSLFLGNGGRSHGAGWLPQSVCLRDKSGRETVRTSTKPPAGDAYCSLLAADGFEA